MGGKLKYLKDGFGLERTNFSAILHLPFEGQCPANWLKFIDICGVLPVLELGNKWCRTPRRRVG
jgi:hypothetical protein